jgi:hypothetical protein
MARYGDCALPNSAPLWITQMDRQRIGKDRPGPGRKPVEACSRARGFDNLILCLDDDRCIDRPIPVGAAISDFHCNPKPAAFVSHEIATYPARGPIVNVGCGANVKVKIPPPLDTAISSLPSPDRAVACQNWSWGTPLLAQVLPKSSEICKTPLNWASLGRPSCPHPWGLRAEPQRCLSDLWLTDLRPPSSAGDPHESACLRYFRRCRFTHPLFHQNRHSPAGPFLTFLSSLSS